MGRAVSSLLVAAILICPLVCRTGHAARHDGGKAEHGCGCCHQASSNPNDGESCPGDRSPNGSGHSCQCICGGAVVDDAGGVQVDFDWGWSMPLVPIADFVGQSSEIQLRDFSIAPWPDVGLNHGRALCCLYNTFLC